MSDFEVLAKKVKDTYNGKNLQHIVRNFHISIYLAYVLCEPEKYKNKKDGHVSEEIFNLGGTADDVKKYLHCNSRGAHMLYDHWKKEKMKSTMKVVSTQATPEAKVEIIHTITKEDENVTDAHNEEIARLKEQLEQMKQQMDEAKHATAKAEKDRDEALALATAEEEKRILLENDLTKVRKEKEHILNTFNVFPVAEELMKYSKKYENIHMDPRKAKYLKGIIHQLFVKHEYSVNDALNFLM